MGTHREPSLLPQPSCHDQVEEAYLGSNVQPSPKKPKIMFVIGDFSSSTSSAQHSSTPTSLLSHWAHDSNGPCQASSEQELPTTLSTPGWAKHHRRENVEHEEGHAQFEPQPLWQWGAVLISWGPSLTLSLAPATTRASCS